jgi:hypothetical protein
MRFLTADRRQYKANVDVAPLGDLKEMFARNLFQ